MKKSFFALLSLLLLTACGGKKVSDNWLKSDDVHIAVDETFFPIMEEQLAQFALTYPEAEVKSFYCSEDSAINLLLKDSLRSVVITRKLSDKEKEIIKSHTLSAMESLIATDAFALVVNKNSPDTTITLNELKGIANGTITRWEQIKYAKRKGEIKLVFDHSGSSTVRWMKDSLCGGKDLKGNVFAQGSAKEVLKAVQEREDIIGVVGADWLRDKDTVLTSYSHLPYNVMLVSRGEGSYHRRPYQYYIATGEYPLTRSVYAITTDPRTRSQEKYLFFWLKGQKGQLIFVKNSQLLPYMQVQVRDVKITN